MSKMPWFRMYADFLNDPKMIALAFEDQRHFIGVLALKSDGAIDDTADENLLNRIVAQRIWIDHGVIREVKKRLCDAGLIEENWQPIAWDKRQSVSDSDSTAAERKRRERAAKSGKENVTDMSRVTSRDSHGDVTRLDTDTDTDTEKDLSPSAPKFVLPEWINADDWHLWLKTRKGKKMIEAQMRKQIDKLAAWRIRGLDHAKALSDAAANGYQGLFEPKSDGLKNEPHQKLDNSAPARVKRENERRERERQAREGRVFDGSPH